MITATTRDHAAHLTNLDDIFDLEATYVEWVTTETQDDRRGVFHPSAVGGCARRGVYEYIGTPRVQMNTEKDLEVFRMGHSVHGIVQGILADLGRVLTPRGIKYSFREEVSFDPLMDTLFLDLGIGGTTDGILEMECLADGWAQRAVVEIKSSKGKLFDAIRGPKPDHEMQANLYAFRYDCPVIYYWYYNKDNSDRKVFKRAASDKALEMALERFTAQRMHADSGTLPDREESFYMCPRCEYGHVCQPDSLQRIHAQHKITTLQKKGFGRK